MLSLIEHALLTGLELGVAALALYFVGSTIRDLWLAIRGKP